MSTKPTINQIAAAILVTIIETPETMGVPGGLLYAPLMGYISLDDFQMIMGTLTDAGFIVRRGQCYFPGNLPSC